MCGVRNGRRPGGSAASASARHADEAGYSPDSPSSLKPGSRLSLSPLRGERAGVRGPAKLPRSAPSSARPKGVIPRTRLLLKLIPPDEEGSPAGTCCRILLGPFRQQLRLAQQGGFPPADNRATSPAVPPTSTFGLRISAFGFLPAPSCFSRPSSPAGGIVTASISSRDIWVSGSNCRSDSSSSPKNSSRTGQGLVSGKTSRMPPRKAISPFWVTCASGS